MFTTILNLFSYVANLVVCIHTLLLSLSLSFLLFIQDLQNFVNPRQKSNSHVSFEINNNNDGNNASNSNKSINANGNQYLNNRGLKEVITKLNYLILPEEERQQYISIEINKMLYTTMESIKEKCKEELKLEAEQHQERRKKQRNSSKIIEIENLEDWKSNLDILEEELKDNEMDASRSNDRSSGMGDTLKNGKKEMEEKIQEKINIQNIKIIDNETDKDQVMDDGNLSLQQQHQPGLEPQLKQRDHVWTESEQNTDNIPSSDPDLKRNNEQEKPHPQQQSLDESNVVQSTEKLRKSIYIDTTDGKKANLDVENSTIDVEYITTTSTSNTNNNNTNENNNSNNNITNNNNNNNIHNIHNNNNSNNKKNNENESFFDTTKEQKHINGHKIGNEIQIHEKLTDKRSPLTPTKMRKNLMKNSNISLSSFEIPQ
eukprot:Awhi_evm2s417